MKKRMILCFACFLLCSCTSTSTDNEDYEKKLYHVDNEVCELTLYHTDLPQGIYYDGKIYWETSIENTSVKGEKIGVLQEVAKPNCFPVSNYTGTDAMEEYKGSELYKYRDTIYLKKGKDIHVLQYIETDAREEPIERYEGSQSADYAVPPHFFYNDMRYQTYQGEEIELPGCFQKAGTIKKNLFIAGENLTGNVPKDSILYAADFQNRFMILKNSEDEKYYLFENTSYR